MRESMCDANACLENGGFDSDCCGLESQTSCRAGFIKSVGDICWNANGARRTCCTPISSLAANFSQSAGAHGSTIPVKPNVPGFFFSMPTGTYVACLAAAVAVAALLAFAKKSRTSVSQPSLLG